MSDQIPTSEDLQQRAFELLQEAVGRDPETAKIGIIVSERLGIPSAQFLCLWFNGFDELSKFITHGIPFSYCSIETLDEIPPEFSEIARAIETNGITPKTTLDLMSINNRLLEGVSIEWVGTFDDLCLGMGEIENQIRRWFRSDDEDAQVLDQERIAFKEFLINDFTE